MRLRRYKVQIVNSDGNLDLAFFFTLRGAKNYARAWIRHLVYRYSNEGYMDPYAWFVVKKWLPEEKAWDIVHLYGGPNYISDVFLGRDKA